MARLTRVLALGLGLWACMTLHEIAAHLRLSAVALSVIAMRDAAPPPPARVPAPARPRAGGSRVAEVR